MLLFGTIVTGLIKAPNFSEVITRNFGEEPSQYFRAWPNFRCFNANFNARCCDLIIRPITCTAL